MSKKMTGPERVPVRLQRLTPALRWEPTCGGLPLSTDPKSMASYLYALTCAEAWTSQGLLRVQKNGYRWEAGVVQKFINNRESRAEYLAAPPGEIREPIKLDLKTGTTGESPEEALLAYARTATRIGRHLGNRLDDESGRYTTRLVVAVVAGIVCAACAWLLRATTETRALLLVLATGGAVLPVWGWVQKHTWNRGVRRQREALGIEELSGSPAPDTHGDVIEGEPGQLSFVPAEGVYVDALVPPGEAIKSPRDPLRILTTGNFTQACALVRHAHDPTALLEAAIKQHPLPGEYITLPQPPSIRANESVSECEIAAEAVDPTPGVRVYRG